MTSLLSRSRLLPALGLVCALTLACSPALNWRKVRPDNAAMSLLLPCKPDRAQKTVPLGGKPTVLGMLGCEADGATYALAVADIGEASQAGVVLAQWQSLALANMQAKAPATQPFTIRGAAADPAPVRVIAQGRQADGRAVEGQAVYFARGSQLFQAVIYAPRISAEAAETFFSSLVLE